jgi:hypothetical protein
MKKEERGKREKEEVGVSFSSLTSLFVFGLAPAFDDDGFFYAIDSFFGGHAQCLPRCFVSRLRARGHSLAI